jgi:hypothetical protein
MRTGRPSARTKSSTQTGFQATKPPAHDVHGFTEPAQGRIRTALVPSFPVPPPSASP